MLQKEQQPPKLVWDHKKKTRKQQYGIHQAGAGDTSEEISSGTHSASVSGTR